MYVNLFFGHVMATGAYEKAEKPRLSSPRTPVMSNANPYAQKPRRKRRVLSLRALVRDVIGISRRAKADALAPPLDRKTAGGCARTSDPQANGALRDRNWRDR